MRFPLHIRKRTVQRSRDINMEKWPIQPLHHRNPTRLRNRPISLTMAQLSLKRFRFVTLTITPTLTCHCGDTLHIIWISTLRSGKHNPSVFSLLSFRRCA